MKQITNNPDESTPDLTATQWYRKRRTESPWFWLQVLGGSLVFHGIVLAIALPLTARLSAASADGSPTPVEFVELAEPETQPPVESVAPAEPAPVEPAPAESVAEPIAPVQQSEPIAPTAPSIAFAPEPSPILSPSPETSPESSILPEASPSPIAPTEPPIEPPVETAVSPQPDSLPLPVLPSTSEASPEPLPEALPEPEQPPQSAALPSPEPVAPEPSIPEASPQPETPAPEEAPPEAPSEPTPDRPPFPEAAAPQPSPEPVPPEPQPSPGLETTPIDAPVPDVSGTIAAAPSTVDTENLEAANSQATAPTGVTLSLANTSRVPPRGDTPVETLELARPIDSSTSFLPDPLTSACQVTPDVLNRAGTPIALQITTDEQGKVLNVSVNQSSNSPEYDQLAACLVKEQWRFEAATVENVEGTGRQPIASDELLITITINRN
jgi:TonB family protein